MTSKRLHGGPPHTAAPIPASERVLDRLADILYASDEVLDMLHEENSSVTGDREIEASIRGVYATVDDLLKRFSD